MPVEDVFSITGQRHRGNGQNRKRGTLKVQDQVEIVGLTEETRTVVVTGVEMFSKLSRPGGGWRQHRSAVKRGVQRNEIERGQVLAKPGSIKPHTAL
jgi:elongation factor Tu